MYNCLSKPIKNLFFLPMLFFCIPVFAVINQSKLWAGMDITGSLFDSQNILYDFAPQTRSNLSAGVYEETHTEAALGYKILPNASVWQGYTSVLPGTVVAENDLWQQAIWEIIKREHFDFSNRIRLEERSRQGEAQWAETLREKWIVAFPHAIFNKFAPIFTEEVFFNLNHPVWVNDQVLNQNRAFIGIRTPMAKHVSFDIGYLNQYVFSNNINEDNNIIYLNVNIIT